MNPFETKLNQEIVYKVTNLTQTSGASPPELSALETKIITFLANQSQPIPEKLVHHRIKGRRISKLKSLRMLIIKELVGLTGAGRRNKPFRYFLMPSSIQRYSGTHRLSEHQATLPAKERKMRS